MLLRLMALNARRNLICNTHNYMHNNNAVESSSSIIYRIANNNLDFQHYYSTNENSKFIGKNRRNDKNPRLNRNQSTHERDENNQKLNRNQPTHERDLFILKNDPDVFGTLASTKKPFDGNEPIAKELVDKGDIAEENFLQNIPFRSDEWPSKRYADLIKKNFRDKRLKEAIDVVEVKMIKEHRVKPSNYMYNLLIGECGRLGYDKKAFQLYNRMKQRDLKATGGTYTALFNACGNTPFPKEGLKKANLLRKIMIQAGYMLNETNYNAMVKAYGRCGDIKTAFQLVDEMKEKKLRMELPTLNHLLQACCTDKEYGFRHALLVWHKIYHRGLLPDIYTFNLMLRITRECGIGDMQTMRQVISSILSGSNRNPKVKLRKNQISLIEDKPSIDINQNQDEANNEQQDLTTTLIEETSQQVCDQMPNLLSKMPHLGSLVTLNDINAPEDRLLMLGGISGFLDEMQSANVKPDIKTFTQLLYTTPSTKKIEVDMIKRMRKIPVRADVDFFNLLMKRRILRQDYEGAKEVLGMIETVRLHPDIVTYGIMAMGCSTRQQGQDFFQQVCEKGIRVNNEILGAMLRNATIANDYDYVMDILKIAKSENVKPSMIFLQKITNFNSRCYRSIKKGVDPEEKNKIDKFLGEYRQWKKDMGLAGLSWESSVKMVQEHPWNQFKENQLDGVECLKNFKKQRLWKRLHSVNMLKGHRLDKTKQKAIETSSIDEVNEDMESKD